MTVREQLESAIKTSLDDVKCAYIRWNGRFFVRTFELHQKGGYEDFMKSLDIHINPVEMMGYVWFHSGAWMDFKDGEWAYHKTPVIPSRLLN